MSLRRLRAGRGGAAEEEPPPLAIAAARGDDLRVAALRSAEPETAAEFVAEIGRLWTRAQKAFLDVGRLLIVAKARLPHGEYQAHVEARLPFSVRTAHMLRTAAEWALEQDGTGRVPLARLPASYTTIYLLSSFEDGVVETAVAEDVIRPDARRAEILRWRRERFGTAGDQAGLEAELRQLLRERERIEARIQVVRESLGLS